LFRVGSRRLGQPSTATTTTTTLSHSALSASVLEPVLVCITPVAAAFQRYRLETALKRVCLILFRVGWRRQFWSTGTTYYHQSLLLLAVCFRACTCLHHTRRCCIPALPPRDSTEEGVFIALVCVAKVVFCLKLPSTTMTTLSHYSPSASVLEPVSVCITPVAAAFQRYRLETALKRVCL
jgi:hypothetical protein